MSKRFNLVNVTALVKSILEEDKRARNSDSFLYLRVLKHIESEQREKLNSVTVFDFLLNLQGKVYPCFESVRRSRQKIQREYPELAACEEVKAYRDENEEMYREYARSEF